MTDRSSQNTGYFILTFAFIILSIIAGIIYVFANSKGFNGQGIPSENSNKNSLIFNSIKSFKEQLIKKFSIEIIFWDEGYTSVIAKQRVMESVNKKSKRQDKGLLDMNSAAIILQEYLDAK